MQWMQLFSSTILSRGRTYFKKNLVMKCQEKDGEFALSVQGTKRYQVKIQFKDGDIFKIHCTCPNSRGGFYCKHMAASLFYMESKGLLEKETVYPITQLQMNLAALPGEPADLTNQNEDRYRYFNCDLMKQKFMLTKDQMQEVEKLIETGTVRLDSVQTGYHTEYRGAGGLGRYSSYRSSWLSDSEELDGVATGIIKEKTNQHLVKLWFDKEQITRAECMVSGCLRTYHCNTRFGEQNLCVHQTALLLLLEKYLNTYNPGDSTSMAAASLLDQYRVRRNQSRLPVAELLEKPLNLTLKPRLQAYRTEWKISFKITGNKTFVLKNLSEFVSQVENRQRVLFGNTTEWQLGLDVFSEQGRRYFEWIRQVVHEEEERKRAGRLFINGYGNTGEVGMNVSGIKDSILLFGRRLDDFYEVVGNDLIEWISLGEKKALRLKCREWKPDVRLFIRKDVDSKQVFQGIRVTGRIPELLYTPQSAYFIENEYLNRVPDEDLEAMKPILELGRNEDVSIHIGRKHLGEFYHNVLPVMKKHVSIVETDRDEIVSYLPPEAAFVFYLDAEENDVTCRGLAVYGEHRIALEERKGIDYGSEHRFASEFSLDDVVEDYRDLEIERETVRKIQSLFSYWDSEKACFCCGGEEEQIYRILNGGVNELLKLGEVHVTDRWKRLNMRRMPQITVGISVESQILNLSLSSEEVDLREVLEILESYRKKRSFHRLKNGDFFDLGNGNETLEFLNQLIESMHIPVKEFVKGKMQIPAYRSLYLDKMLESCEGIYVDRDKRFKALIREFKTVSDADFEIPQSLQKILRPYQETGYRWLRTLDTYGFGGILADDMGLGKTLQIIALLLSARGTGTSMIVTPASLVYNWGAEFRKFAPDLKICLVTGTLKERHECIGTWKNYDVLVTSYDLLKRDIAEYEACEFHYEVLDEAQYIKNHTTAAAKAVKVLKSRQRFALTGTPIENRLSELWSIFDYLMPGYLYSYDGFKKEFEMPIVKHQEEGASRRLKRMTAPFILRRLKTQVLKDLPDKLEEVYYVKLEGEQQRLMDGQVAHMKMFLQKTEEPDFGKNKMKLLAELVRIRQICCDPSLCFEDYHGSSAKREACMELIRSGIAGEHKMLIFSQFTSMLELLEEDLKGNTISYYKITGETSKEERLRLVNAYNQDATPVFLISLKAGGTGLNLTGADVVIHYDPWWNLAVQNQATDRAHRIGQTKEVTVYKIIAQGTIEEKILMMQETKKNLADEILSGETGTLAAMSREELLQLLE